MQLSVFGLGHAGAVVAGCLVSQGHEVIAFDQDADKVDMLRRGLAPVNEPGLDGLIKEAVASGKLTATTNVAEAVANSVLSAICAATPALSRDSRDLAEVTSICKQIGIALGTKMKFHSIVLRTALPTDATRGLLIPTLERASAKRAGVDFGVAVYPAFLRRGSAIQDCINPPAILFGVTDDETLARLREMEIALQAPEMVVDLAEAEAVTHADGRWPAVNAAGVNAAGVNGPAVNALAEKRSTTFPGFPIAANGLCSW